MWSGRADAPGVAAVVGLVPGTDVEVVAEPEGVVPPPVRPAPLPVFSVVEAGPTRTLVSTGVVFSPGRWRPTVEPMRAAAR